MWSSSNKRMNKVRRSPQDGHDAVVARGAFGAFSRKIVAWTIDTAESDKVARRLVHTACRREGIDTDELTLHSDRGAQMTSTTPADLLEDLGVTRSLSRWWWRRCWAGRPAGELELKELDQFLTAGGGSQRTAGTGSCPLSTRSLGTSTTP